jgi:hypothetical protein
LDRVEWDLSPTNSFPSFEEIEDSIEIVKRLCPNYIKGRKVQDLFLFLFFFIYMAVSQ